VAAAVAVAGYQAWLFWGTGLVTARAQSQLRAEITSRIETPRWAKAPPPRAPVVLPGGAMAIVRIPKIGLDMVVVQGTTVDDLKKGPGHYANTAFPWQQHGRVGIAGHRTTYARPFWSLDELGAGDEIVLVTEFGSFHYRVTGSRVILPTERWVLARTRKPTLVLTTCTPRFSASHRLVVFAERVS
jgi:sortase A